MTPAGTWDGPDLLDLMTAPFSEDLLGRLHPAHQRLIEAHWPTVAALRPAFREGQVLVLSRQEGAARLAGAKALRKELRRNIDPSPLVLRHLLRPQGLVLVLMDGFLVSAVSLSGADGGLVDLSGLESAARWRWRQVWRAARIGDPWASPFGASSGATAAELLTARESYPVCMDCGCTPKRACPGGCTWASFELCTACAPWPAHLREQMRAAARRKLGILTPSSPITVEEDMDLGCTGPRVFKLDRFGRAVDSLLLARDEDPEEDGEAAAEYLMECCCPACGEHEDDCVCPAGAALRDTAAEGGESP